VPTKFVACIQIGKDKDRKIEHNAKGKRLSICKTMKYRPHELSGDSIISESDSALFLIDILSASSTRVLSALFVSIKVR